MKKFEMDQRVKITRAGSNVHGKFGKVIEIDPDWRGNSLVKTWYLVELEYQGDNDTPNEWCTEFQLLAAATPSSHIQYPHPVKESNITIPASKWFELQQYNMELEDKISRMKRILNDVYQ